MLRKERLWEAVCTWESQGQPSFLHQCLQMTGLRKLAMAPWWRHPQGGQARPPAQWLPVGRTLQVGAGGDPGEPRLSRTNGSAFLWCLQTSTWVLATGRGRPARPPPPSQGSPRTGLCDCNSWMAWLPHWPQSPRRPGPLCLSPSSRGGAQGLVGSACRNERMSWKLFRNRQAPPSALLGQQLLYNI